MRRNVILLYFIIILTIAVIAGYTGMVNELPAQKSLDKVEKAVALQFDAVPFRELVKRDPDQGWVRARSYQYVGIEGMRSATIHLYAIPSKDKQITKSEIHAFLEDDGTFYEIDTVGEAGIKNIFVEPVECGEEAVKLIKILGGNSAASDEIWYIKYDEGKGVWVSVLNMGTPLFADLDSNGEEDLAAVSPAGMNPYVCIYRWKDGRFEKADIASQTGCNYASLVRKNINKQNIWLIQAGFAKDDNEKLYYAYQAGSLMLQENVKQ